MAKFIFDRKNKRKKSILATDDLLNIVQDGKEIKFYTKSITGRENWVYETEKDATESFEKILAQLGTKII